MEAERRSYCRWKDQEECGEKGRRMKKQSNRKGKEYLTEKDLRIRDGKKETWEEFIRQIIGVKVCDILFYYQSSKI